MSGGRRGVVVALVAAAVVVLGVWFLSSPGGDDDGGERSVAVSPSASPSASGAAAAAPTGSFEDREHPTSGTATVATGADGARVLSLTGFRTDPGPDLRVMLVPDPTGESVEGGVDLGELTSATGDQEYAVPAGSPLGAVVIWCREFTVNFGTASLST